MSPARGCSWLRPHNKQTGVPRPVEGPFAMRAPCLLPVFPPVYPAHCAPFCAGTYLPPTDSFGRPGFKTLLQRIAQASTGGAACADGGGRPADAGLASSASACCFSACRFSLLPRCHLTNTVWAALLLLFLPPAQVWDTKRDEIKASSAASMRQLADLMRPEVGRFGCAKVRQLLSREKQRGVDLRLQLKGSSGFRLCSCHADWLLSGVCWRLSVAASHPFPLPQPSPEALSTAQLAAAIDLCAAQVTAWGVCCPATWFRVAGCARCLQWTARTSILLDADPADLLPPHPRTQHS